MRERASRDVSPLTSAASDARERWTGWTDAGVKCYQYGGGCWWIRGAGAVGWYLYWSCVEIQAVQFVTAAISQVRVDNTQKKTFYLIGNWFFRYYLSLARSVVIRKCSQVPTRLEWLLTPYGHRFLTSSKWNYSAVDPSLFSSMRSPADPLSHVMRVSERFNFPAMFFLFSSTIFLKFFYWNQRNICLEFFFFRILIVVLWIFILFFHKFFFYYCCAVFQ